MPIVGSKPKKIWDNYREVGEIQKTATTKLVLAAGIKDGIRQLNIREFYFRKRDSQWCAAIHGITIPLDFLVEGGTKHIQPYKQLIEMLPKVVETLQAMPISDEANAIWYTPKEKPAPAPKAPKPVLQVGVLKEDS